MNLPTSTPGVTSPYQTDVNNQTAFGLIDSHNHTSGKGVPIPPAGININAPLPFNGNPSTFIGYVGLVDAGAGPSIPITLWNDGTNFWVEDGLGNKIELTCNGGICVSIGGDAGGSLTISNLTVTTSFTGPGGIGIGGGCLTSTSGAKYCFDGSGGLSEVAVDGGQIVLQTGGSNYLEIQAAAALTPGALTVGELLSSTSVSATTGNPVGYDLLNVGNTTEVGSSLMTTVPLNGVYRIDTGGSTLSIPFELFYDGGASFEVTRGGAGLFGYGPTSDMVIVVPEPGGSGYAVVAASSNNDTNVNLDLEAQGTGQISMGNPVGTIGGPLILNSDAGTQIGNIGNETPITHSRFIAVYVAAGASAGQGVNPISIKTGVTPVCDGSCSNATCICGPSSCVQCTSIGIANYGDTLGATVGDTCSIGGNQAHSNAFIVEACKVSSKDSLILTEQQLAWDAGWNAGVLTCECNSH
jgi:hypothetical protein